MNGFLMLVFVISISLGLLCIICGCFSWFNFVFWEEHLQSDLFSS